MLLIYVLYDSYIRNRNYLFTYLPLYLLTYAREGDFG